MPIKALRFKPGIHREGTSYSNEGGWYDGDKIRFNKGLPEKIGGWQRISEAQYLGVCRSIFSWASLGGLRYMSVGTNIKFYAQNGGEYFDITPIRATEVLNDPFATVNGSPIVTVSDTNHDALAGDYVTFSLGAAVAGLNLNAEYTITTVIDANSYTITASSNANATVAAGGGATVLAEYQVGVGLAAPAPFSGWGGGPWGTGTWGVGTDTTLSLRLWNVSNFGEDLVLGPRGGGVYYWDSSSGFTDNRGVNISTLPGASGVPTVHNYLLVSDVSRFVLLFGADAYAGPAGEIDPMLIRWSDQESAADWTPSITSKAGELRLSNGSMIVAAEQTRQEIVVFTDTAVYSLQYVGAPIFWGAQLLSGSNSIMSPRAVVQASGALYWMGKDKFYVYDGRVQTLPCAVREYVFNDFNLAQQDQVFGGSVSEFDEVWWFYCSGSSSEIDRYVVYNYAENCWYYGTMERTAWSDSGLLDYPVAASQATQNLLYHEIGVDDESTATPAAIASFLESAQFAIDDGDRFAFVTKVLPDMTFSQSTDANPSASLTLKALKGSGAGYNTSKGGLDQGSVTRTATAPIEQYTDQVYIRIRGRQLVFRIDSENVGVGWQLGIPRIDSRPDGRRG